jgi:protein-L-isoaspartate(D-aspartate) O-methyltransferase
VEAVLFMGAPSFDARVQASFPAGHTRPMGLSPAEALMEELRGAVSDERVLRAIAAVPRDEFVPRRLRGRAGCNAPLPIGGGQTISQPLVVAHMCSALRLTGTERVLDVGSGSGWHAAILARLSAHVWSVERDRRLSAMAESNLRAAGADNVTLVIGDGSTGLAEVAPFDAINAAAAGDESALGALEGQLADGGRLVAPVRMTAAGEHQQLVLSVRRGRRIRRRALGPVSFVPLVRG